MKVASVIFQKQDYKKITQKPADLLIKIKNWLREGHEQQVDIIVLPALIGNFYNQAESKGGASNNYLEEILSLSLDYKDITICPGSWWEEDKKTDDRLIYHSSALIHKGKVLCKQRQLYLARWERELGLTRGSELSICSLGDFSICIQLATDLFYPQVSRYAALSGVNLVLAPSAIKGPPSFPRQISGLWQQVQQNLFFAVESGFKGIFAAREFNTESIIHAPIAITESEDGFLKREPSLIENKSLLIADLDLAARAEALKGFNPLKQLNPDFYKQNH